MQRRKLWLRGMGTQSKTQRSDSKQDKYMKTAYNPATSSWDLSFHNSGC